MMSDNQQLSVIGTQLAQNVAKLERENEELRQAIVSIGQLMVGMDAKLKGLEALLSQKVTVNAKQARAISAAVASTARRLCEKYGFDYTQDGDTFRRAIWRDVKKQYGVADVHDLPAAYFDLALQLVNGWSSFSLVRKLRDKKTAR